MPSKSWKQHKLMEKAAHDAEFAKEHHIDQAVAQEFIEADKKAGLTTEAAFEKKAKPKPKKPKYAEWGKQ